MDNITAIADPAEALTVLPINEISLHDPKSRGWPDISSLYEKYNHICKWVDFITQGGNIHKIKQ